MEVTSCLQYIHFNKHCLEKLNGVFIKIVYALELSSKFAQNLKLRVKPKESERDRQKSQAFSFLSIPQS